MSLKWIVAFFGMCCVSKTSCYVNLANKTIYKGTPSQSSSYGDSLYSADKAVDGQIQKGTDGSSCSFTIGQTEYQSAWWKLPLKLMSNIAYLQIQFRNTLEDRLYGFSVYVFNDSSFEPPSPLGYKVFTYGGPSCPSVMMNVTVNRVTKGIALFNSNDKNHQICKNYDKRFATIDLCEVFVMGCKEKHFGSSCIECDDKCLDRQCDVFNGSCIYGCSDPLMMPPECNVCVDGYYGYPCKQCGNCVNQEVCNKIDGSCQKCEENWLKPLCKECINGFYDTTCNSQCGHCLHGKCMKENGTCLGGCVSHWEVPLCLECVNGYHDENCSTLCGNCNEGFCDKKNGSCLSGCKLNWLEPLCQDCADGFYGVDCRSQCGHCLGGACDKTNGVCMSGCSANWQEPLCQILTTRESTTDDEEFSKTSLVVISVISTLLGVLLMGALIIIIYIKRKRCLPQKNNDHSNNDEISCKDTEQKYDEITNRTEDHNYTTFDSANKETEYQEIHTYSNTEFN